MGHAQDVTHNGYLVVDCCELLSSPLAILLLDKLLSLIKFLQCFDLVALFLHLAACIEQLLYLVTDALHALKFLLCHF